MHRRDVLTGLLAAGLAPLSSRLFAAPADSGRFLLVFLRGGYDAANLLVPAREGFYHAVRPNIAVAPPDPADPLAALPLDADWALHPALKESMYPLFARGQLAFVPFAGTADLSRSHFETQDSIEAGLAQGNALRASGFLNRLVAALGGTEAMAFTDQLPLVLQGSVPVPNQALHQMPGAGIDPRQAAMIAAMYKGQAQEQAVVEGFGVRADTVQRLAGEMDAASRHAVNARGFEGEARRIGRLMRERYAVGFVDVGGWDTHAGEGGGSGYLAGRLGELGRGLAAFADEMGPRWRETCVVVISEFGRTYRENGTRGTDHGHGTVYWVLGGGVRGGRLAGEQIVPSAATLFQQRDFPVLNEYRAVLGGLFARQFGLSPDRLASVFPGARPQDLGLL